MVVALGVLKSSRVYVEAVQRAQASADVQRILGSNIEPGFWVTGSISTDSSTGGAASLRVPLSGSSSSGTLLIEADRGPGATTWDYATLELMYAEDGQSHRLQLLNGSRSRDGGE